MRWATAAERRTILEQRGQLLADPPADNDAHDVATPRYAPVYVLGGPNGYVLIPGNRASFAQIADDTPLGIVEPADLDDPAFWRTMLALHPVSVVDLARWWRSCIPHASPVGMMLAHGLANNHRSLADWKEMAELDDSSALLHRLHELPLSTLRLWNRLAEDTQSAWWSVFTSRHIKRNLIREIITDFYDLSPEDRASILTECLGFAAAWGENPAPFPAQQLRDRVHRKRYARSEVQRSELFALKRRMGLPRWLDVEIPPDLEATNLRIRADLDSEEAVDELAALLQNEKQRDTLRKIREQLQS